MSLEEFGAKAVQWGYRGIDLVVRPGHRVDLDNVEKNLPAAVQVWAGMGLSCPLVSAPVDFNDPTAAAAERLFAACAAAGVGHIKLGYWYFAEGQGYWPQVERARAGLEGFAALAERFGVKACYHTHSGPCIGSNCAGLMHLLRGFDPALVGAYPDLGHMALDGEEPAMGLAMLERYLALIGVKDGCHAPNREGQGAAHVPLFTPLGAGSVDWRRVLALLAGVGFDGPLALHTEYNFDEGIIRQVGYEGHPPEGLEDGVRADAAFLGRIEPSLVSKK